VHYSVLEAVERELYLLELLCMLEAMRCVLLCVLEAVEGDSVCWTCWRVWRRCALCYSLDVLGVLEMPGGAVLRAILYNTRGCGGWALLAGGAGVDALCATGIIRGCGEKVQFSRFRNFHCGNFLISVLHPHM